MPRVGLFIPCYIDQFYPDVGLATVEVLERFGCEVDFPAAQTCCGQPMANTGCVEDVRPLARRFVELFGDYEYVVCPSGSCTAMIRQHYGEYFHGESHAPPVLNRVFELTEFLVDVLQVERIGGSFPYRVGLHQSCHGLRELRLASSSEVVRPAFNKVQKLLDTIADLKVVPLKRPDECCGFGGTFAINEEAVSCLMGMDRIDDHEQAGAEIIAANDMSCLMHLGGLISRQKRSPRVMHLAQILAGRPAPV